MEVDKGEDISLVFVNAIKRMVYPQICLFVMFMFGICLLYVWFFARWLVACWLVFLLYF